MDKEKSLEKTFGSFASHALSAFLGWEHFPEFRDKILTTLWRLEHVAQLSLNLAEQYEAVELLVRMTVKFKSYERRLYSHLDWSPRLRHMVLEYSLKHDILILFCAIWDRGFRVPDEQLDSLLDKYPTYRWAIDFRRGRSIVDHCSDIAIASICPNGNHDFVPNKKVKLSPHVYGALAKIAAFAEDGLNRELRCAAQNHISKLHRKYLDRDGRKTTQYSSFIEVIVRFTDNLKELAQRDTRSDMFIDLRELIEFIEEDHDRRTPNFSCAGNTKEALDKFWRTVIELDREHLLTVAGASDGASEKLISSAIAGTAVGQLTQAKPEMPRSMEFLFTSDDPDLRLLRRPLVLCVDQAKAKFAKNTYVDI